MMLPHYLAYIIVLFALAPFSTHAAQPSTPFVVSGVTSNSGAARSMQYFVDYLNQHSNLNLQIHYADSYSKLSNIMRNNPQAFGWTCGAPYVEDAANDQQQLISVPLFKKQPTYHSLIITSKIRPEKHLLDFKGKIFAYSDKRSNSGYIAPLIQLKKQNIDIHNFFSVMINTGNHENSIIALLNGLADVAAIDEYVWIEYTRKHPETLNTLYEIERSGPYPFTPIVASRGVSAEKIKSLQNTLTHMNNDPHGNEILSDFGLDGFVIKSKEFYQPIQDMLQQLEPQEEPQ